MNRITPQKPSEEPTPLEAVDVDDIEDMATLVPLTPGRSMPSALGPLRERLLAFEAGLVEAEQDLQRRMEEMAERLRQAEDARAVAEKKLEKLRSVLEGR